MANADGLGTLRLLEAVRILGLKRPRPVLPSRDVRIVMARSAKFRKARRIPFTRARHTQRPNSMPIG